MATMEEGFFVEDCVAFMSRMDEKSIDLTVTSPPYDNLRDYKGYSFDFENIATHLFRVTKQGGVVVWVVMLQRKRKLIASIIFGLIVGLLVGICEVMAM